MIFLKKLFTNCCLKLALLFYGPIILCAKTANSNKFLTWLIYCALLVSFHSFILIHGKCSCVNICHYSGELSPWVDTRRGLRVTDSFPEKWEGLKIFWQINCRIVKYWYVSWSQQVFLYPADKSLFPSFIWLPSRSHSLFLSLLWLCLT